MISTPKLTRDQQKTIAVIAIAACAAVAMTGLALAVPAMVVSAVCAGTAISMIENAFGQQHLKQIIRNHEARIDNLLNEYAILDTMYDRQAERLAATITANQGPELDADAR
jgi:uncharacterized membrane-anchored protein YitT (DUF2179 family)